MKNILFLHSSSEMYGSDRSLLNIVRNIDKTQYKVFVLLPCPGPLVDAMAAVPDVTVEIFEVAVLRRKNLSVKGGFSYLRDFIASYRYIKNFIKSHHIDIVDTNTAVVFPGAIAAKHAKIKSVWHIREIIKSNLENKVISFTMQRYADLIIANSRATGQALKVDQKKVRVVYNAVEQKGDTDLMPHARPTVGMAGRINRWKGQKLFTDVAQIVKETCPDVCFQIAGEAYAGEEHLRTELEEYIAQKGLTDTVILLGQVNDMDSFYKGLDIFALPSTQPEPFGLVVIEAMEYAIPVVATNHGGPTEIIADGEDGYLVSHESAEEMAQRISMLLQDNEKRTQMGKIAQEKKRRLFSVASMVRQIEAVFTEVSQ